MKIKKYEPPRKLTSEEYLDFVETCVRIRKKQIEIRILREELKDMQPEPKRLEHQS